MDVSENRWVFPPNHPILIGFSNLNHPFWGTPIFGNTQVGPDFFVTEDSCTYRALDWEVVLHGILGVSGRIVQPSFFINSDLIERATNGQINLKI